MGNNEGFEEFESSVSHLSGRERLEYFNRKLNDGVTLLCEAARRGNVMFVNYLLDICAVDVDMNDTYFGTTLWSATGMFVKQVDVVATLVHHGANINSLSSKNSTPILNACRAGNAQTVRFLYEHGRNIHRTDSIQTCLVHSVSIRELYDYLIQRGVDINATDCRDATALHYAIESLCAAAAKLPLNYNADVTIKND